MNLLAAFNFAIFEQYFNNMNFYITHKFTLIPAQYFTQEEARDAMCNLFDISDKEEIKYTNIENINAVLIYSLPIELKSKESDSTYYPLANLLLEYITEINDYNKVVFHFNKEQEIAHILISKGNNLQLLNTYNAKNFNSALYFLLLAIKQTIINSHQTILHVLNNMSAEEKDTAQNYFKKIKIKKIEKI